MSVYKDACRAAGFIIYRKTENGHEILGLKALPKFQSESKGVYDLPKGQIDYGETPLECAYRECFEECGITPGTAIAGPFTHGKVWLWLAESNDTPIIKPNAVTGKLEHLGYDWLNPDDIINNCLDYLRPSLVWARSILENEN